MRNDAQLVEMAKNGDRDAFAELAERYRGLLHAAGYSVLGSRDEAEDVAQEAIIRIFSKIHTFRTEGSFPRWAYVIARNAAIARLRSRSREVPLDELVDVPSPQAEDTAPDLQACLNTLPEGLKETVLMHYIDGYTSEEISESLGVASGTVRSRLTKARRILRGELIGMVKRELSQMMSREQYTALVEWLRAFPPVEPDIVVEEVDAPLPDPDFTEGVWSFIPLKADGISFAAWYDHPEKALTDTSFMRVLGKTEIAGEECWEVLTIDEEGRDRQQYRLWYWSVGPDVVKLIGKYFSPKNCLRTWQDADWDEDRRGYPRHPARLPLAQRSGEEEFADPENLPMTPIGTYDVTIGTRKQRCLRVIQAYPDQCILVDAYINAEGRTVLFRRYNAKPYWSKEQLGRSNWPGAIERLAELGNKRLVFNDKEYYHWYDCITDSAMQCAPPMIHGKSNRWYHGSPNQLSTLAPGSTVTPAIELARAFSHKPTNVNVRIQDGDAGHKVEIEHDGKAEGYLYEVLVDDPATDLIQHPESGFFPGEEMLTTRELPVRIVEGKD